ncbi:MAG TPA: antibiotic biosynthesis monooxygenase [Polyangia bacterium]|jgi:autoinducer 2-degrading protein
MYVVCVTIQVQPGREEDFIAATEKNHRGTRQEPGNVRFDVLRHAEQPARFFLYEVYRSPADFAAHQQTPHYLAWKEQVGPWMAAPRVGEKHQSLFPAPWA